MSTQTIERARAGAKAGPAGVIGYLGAAALAVAAAWDALAARGVTVASPPRTGPGVPPLQELHAHYRWLVMTLPQERFYTSMAIAGFLCLAAVAVFARDLLGHQSLLARAGALTVGSGALLWVTGSVFQLGGHRAVGLMATHANPIQTTNSVAFTIDMIDQAFALAAFAFIGAGMLAFAWAAVRARAPRRAWAAYTTLISVLILITAWSYAAGNGNLTDAMLLIGGLLLLPGWLAWTAALKGTSAA